MVVEVAGHGAEVLAGDQQRGGEAAQRPLGGRPPPFLALREVDQLAAERHLLLGHARGRRDGAAVLDARRRQQGLARPERDQFLLGRGELAFPGRVAVERLEAQLLERLRVVFQLGRAGGRVLVGLLPAGRGPLEFQAGVGEGLPGRFLHLLAELEPHPGVLQGLLDRGDRVAALVVVVRLELPQLLGQAVPDAALGAEFLGLRLGQVLEPGERFLVHGDGQLLPVGLEFLAGQLPQPVRVEQGLGILLVQPGDRGQLVALLPDVLEALPDGHQVAEFLDDVIGRGQRGGGVQDLVAEEVVDAAAEALAGLDDAQQRQGLVRIDPEQPPEAFREGLVHVEDLGVREDHVQRRLGEALLRDALNCGEVQRLVVDQVVPAHAGLGAVLGQVEQRRHGHPGAGGVVEGQRDGGPGGAGALERTGRALADGLVPHLAAHVRERGPLVLDRAARALGRGLVGTRPRIEDPEHRVEQRGLADAGIAGQQGAVAVHVHRVGAMEGAPVDHLDQGQAHLAGVR